MLDKFDIVDILEIFLDDIITVTLILVIAPSLFKIYVAICHKKAHLLPLRVLRNLGMPT